MKGIKVSDDHDSTKDLKVEVEGKVDTHKPGKQQLTYIVTDSKGLRSKKTITVTVKVGDYSLLSSNPRRRLNEGESLNQFIPGIPKIEDTLPQTLSTMPNEYSTIYNSEPNITCRENLPQTGNQKEAFLGLIGACSSLISGLFLWNKTKEKN